MEKDINIVLLPGWKNTSKSLYIFRESLSKFANLYFIDLPILIKGEPLNIEDYINYLHNKIGDLKNVIIVGHSFGGKIASFYALKYDILGLILIAPSTYLKQKFVTKIKILLSKLLNILNLRKPKFLLGSSDYQKLDEKEKITFKNILKYLTKEELNSINKKVLIIGFKDDNQVSISDLKYLTKHIKSSSLNILNGDHFGYFENVYEISLLIGDFINENY